MSNLTTSNVSTLWFTATEDAADNERAMNATLPLFGIAGILVLAFCLAATLSTDCVRSKPLVALFGVVSTCMGTGMAFGICMYAGVRFSTICYVVPFLMLGKKKKIKIKSQSIQLIFLAFWPGADRKISC
jgi:hypothetical protein